MRGDPLLAEDHRLLLAFCIFPRPFEILGIRCAQNRLERPDKGFVRHLFVWDHDLPAFHAAGGLDHDVAPFFEGVPSGIEVIHFPHIFKTDTDNLGHGHPTFLSGLLREGHAALGGGILTVRLPDADGRTTG